MSEMTSASLSGSTGAEAPWTMQKVGPGGRWTSADTFHQRTYSIVMVEQCIKASKSHPATSIFTSAIRKRRDIAYELKRKFMRL